MAVKMTPLMVVVLIVTVMVAGAAMNRLTLGKS